MEWQQHGDIAHAEGDMIGGDPQAGPSHSKRFVFGPVEGRHMVLTEYAYADHLPNGAYGTATTTEMILCTDPDDPGSTELDADYWYDAASALMYGTLDGADEAAQRYIERAGTHWFGSYDPSRELRKGRLNSTARAETHMREDA